MHAEPFPTRRVADIEPQPIEQKWLVDQLWLAGGVGILGGAPKVCKTFLAAEISVAVATGGYVLGYAAHLTGPVVFYGAEESLPALRARFEGLATVRHLTVQQLPIYLLDIPTLRLERDDNLCRLRAAVERHQPRLLVLDPFVRIARIDENSAADVSAVLASLRAIQRELDVAVLLVHHARKSPAAHPNQALRGSSDFAAWSDSNLYLTRRRKLLTLTIEHRSAPAPDPITCQLDDDPVPHLVPVDLPAQTTNDNDGRTLKDHILRLLIDTRRPLPTVELRQRLHRRKADVVRALDALRALGKIQREPNGWAISQLD